MNSQRDAVIQTAQKTWKRSGRELPPLEADDEILALVEQSQAGDEVAFAGLVLVVSRGVRKVVKKYAWHLEHDPMGTEGLAAGMSMLWFAVDAFDTKHHRVNVGYRLVADVKYLARKPTRRREATHCVSVPDPESRDTDRVTSDDSMVAYEDLLTTAHCERAADEFGLLEQKLWLEQACQNTELSEVHREVATELLRSGHTDRQLASTLNIPAGSIARHRRAIRQALLGELVA